MPSSGPKKSCRRAEKGEGESQRGREGGGRGGERGREGTHDLLLAVQVDDLVLDAGRLAGQEQIEDGVDELAENDLRVGAEVGQDGALGAALGDVLVLERLRRREAVHLVEQVALVDRVVLAVARHLRAAAGGRRSARSVRARG